MATWREVVASRRPGTGGDHEMVAGRRPAAASDQQHTDPRDNIDTLLYYLLDPRARGYNENISLLPTATGKQNFHGSPY